MPSTSEHIIADAVMRVAAKRGDGVATFKRLYAEIPNEIALSQDDLMGSMTRNGEPMWHQIVRNIKSHHEIEGNAIAEGWLIHVPRVGYQITASGRSRIN